MRKREIHIAPPEFRDLAMKTATREYLTHDDIEGIAQDMLQQLKERRHAKQDVIIFDFFAPEILQSVKRSLLPEEQRELLEDPTLFEAAMRPIVEKVLYLLGNALSAEEDPALSSAEQIYGFVHILARDEHSLKSPERVILGTIVGSSFETAFYKDESRAQAGILDVEKHYAAIAKLKDLLSVKNISEEIPASVRMHILVYGAELTSVQRFIAMSNLHSEVSHKRVAFSEALQIMKDIAEGLRYLLQNDLVLGDMDSLFNFGVDKGTRRGFLFDWGYLIDLETVVRSSYRVGRDLPTNTLVYDLQQLAWFFPEQEQTEYILALHGLRDFQFPKKTAGNSQKVKAVELTRLDAFIDFLDEKLARA